MSTRASGPSARQLAPHPTLRVGAVFLFALAAFHCFGILLALGGAVRYEWYSYLLEAVFAVFTLLTGIALFRYLAWAPTALRALVYVCAVGFGGTFLWTRTGLFKWAAFRAAEPFLNDLFLICGVTGLVAAPILLLCRRALATRI